MNNQLIFHAYKERMGELDLIVVVNKFVSHSEHMLVICFLLYEYAFIPYMQFIWR